MDRIDQAQDTRIVTDDGGNSFECKESAAKSKDRKKTSYLRTHCVDVSDVPPREREEDRLAY